MASTANRPQAQHPLAAQTSHLTASTHTSGRRSPTASPTTGSATQTITSTPTSARSSQSPEPLILRLRGAHHPSQRRIHWADDVVDNEGLGRKSSKVCCIYHAPKGVGESSDESSSDDSDGGGSDSGDDGAARPAGGKKGRRRGRGRRTDGGHGHRHGEGHEHGSGGEKERRPSPNAYERQPKQKAPATNS